MVYSFQFFEKYIIYQISQLYSIPHDTRGIVTELQVYIKIVREKIFLNLIFWPKCFIKYQIITVTTPPTIQVILKIPPGFQYGCFSWHYQDQFRSCSSLAQKEYSWSCDQVAVVSQAGCFLVSECPSPGTGWY